MYFDSVLLGGEEAPADNSSVVPQIRLLHARAPAQNWLYVNLVPIFLSFEAAIHL